MTTELAPVPTGRALIMKDVLTHEADQRKLLGEYIRGQMVEGTDYGVIPGTAKKTLLKPGAEKLTQLYRTLPKLKLEDKVENWETGLFHYRFSCAVMLQADESVIVAEGVGSCSTFETRYRYRKQDRQCPECGKEFIKKSKFPPRDQPDAEPGWYCHAKAGGCGANFDADDPDIVSQVVGRVENPDILDAVNTVLKIAKKRALVDAAIALARCSDIFTQDVEDFAEPDADGPASKSGAKPANKPAAKGGSKPAAKQQPPKLTPDEEARAADATALTAELKAKGLKWAECMAWLSAETGKDYHDRFPARHIPADDWKELWQWVTDRPTPGGDGDAEPNDDGPAD